VRELRSSRFWSTMLVLTAIYIVAGKLGLRLAMLNASATGVWPPTGIALAACLILGRRVWPAILVGAFVVNLTTAGSVATSIGIAIGNTLEAVLGSLLVDRYARGARALERAPDIFTYTLLAAGISTMVSATIGVTTLMLGGLAGVHEAGPVWLTWWLGDAGGVMVVAPILLLWSNNLRVHLQLRWVLEAIVLLGVVVLTGQVAFGGALLPYAQNLPLEFITIPACIWAAFRFGRRMSALVVAVVYAFAVWGTMHGLGPFARGSVNGSLLLLQVFGAVIAVTSLVLAAVVAERRRTESQLLQLTVTDELTGLANYRRLLDVLELEVQRAQRTGLPFAVLFLDLDGLKAINDRFGHLVGSRGLWRVAEALRKASRIIDTAARYGGDEFALVLPFSDLSAAAAVAVRVHELLEHDAEQPPITVSVGVALYPRDGLNVAELLAAADQQQYVHKTSARVSGGRRKAERNN